MKKIIIIGIFYYLNFFSQSLTGTTGLISIPTAEIAEDRQVIFGASLLHRKYLDYTDRKFNAMAYYVTLGYLPFLEVSLRFTRRDYPPELRNSSVGDRMLSLRVQVLKEGKYIPMFSLGCHDVGTTLDKGSARHFNCLFLTLSKNFLIEGVSDEIGLHVGYGSDCMESVNHEFTGIFGGVLFKLNSFADLMLEFDSEKINGGARVLIFNRIRLLFSMIHFDVFSFGASYRFSI